MRNSSWTQNEPFGLNFNDGFMCLGSVSQIFWELFGPKIKYSNQNLKNENAGP